MPEKVYGDCVLFKQTCMNLILGGAFDLKRTTFKITASFEHDTVVVRVESNGNSAD